MSEPDIATLARRLAEQNNVDWRLLNGTGPDGKILERDVLDYLARVMAGEEAVDPTPEPLPEGMEAWPDQDAPSYHQPNGASHTSRSESSAASAFVADEVEDDLLAAAPEPAAPEPYAPEPAVPEPYAPEPFAPAPEEPVSFEAEAPTPFADLTEPGTSEDDDLPADIFLLDDTEPEAPVAFGGPAEDPYAHEPSSPFAEPEPEPVEAWSAAADEADDDDLLVADDEPFGAEVDEPVGVGFGDEATAPAFEGFDRVDVHAAEPTTEGTEEDAARFGDLTAEEPASTSVFDAPIGGYDQEFTTASEQFEADEGEVAWTAAPDLVAADDAFEAAGDAGAEAAGDLPDLWAGDDLSAESSADDHWEPFPAVDEPEEAASDFQVVELEEAAAFETEEEHVEHEAQAEDEAGEDLEELETLEAAGDPADLDVATTLDELDAVTDLHQLDGEPETTGVAFTGLPLARTGNVLRRHVDLSALAGAQLAAGLELGHDEPLTPAPFLVRATARAVAERGDLGGQVALAELEGGLHFRRVDDAATRPFASLVAELASAGGSEDELGIVAVDLSGLDMDEVLLDVEVPTVTLGRILYDTQLGAHRSTLTLSGDLPMAVGARLLARVAELLEAPVRLLV